MRLLPHRMVAQDEVKHHYTLLLHEDYRNIDQVQAPSTQLDRIWFHPDNMLSAVGPSIEESHISG